MISASFGTEYTSLMFFFLRVIEILAASQGACGGEISTTRRRGAASWDSSRTAYSSRKRNAAMRWTAGELTRRTSLVISSSPDSLREHCIAFCAHREADCFF